MNILCAPDSFKGSITAIEASQAMIEGAKGIADSTTACPIADGGEGTLSVLLHACRGRSLEIETLDPLGRPTMAKIGFLPDENVAVVEMAQASGLGLLSEDERSPFRTSTYGTGHLMAVAARETDRILLAAGGTATMDGGCGILQAFGSRMLNSVGEPIEDPITNGSLPRIASIETSKGMPIIDVAVDVNAPLLGEEGAAAVFGSQKGAREDDIETLDANLLHLATVMNADGSLWKIPGGGAAGGTAFGLHVMADANIINGTETILEMIDFTSKLEGIDILLVGEGCLDGQTRLGKAPYCAAKHAADLGIRTIAICGALGHGWESSLREHGGPIDSIHALTQLHDSETCLRNPKACIAETTRSILSTL